LLDVLRNNSIAPQDLRERALDLAGLLLDIADQDGSSSGRRKAESMLDSGAALRKFLAICEAQGGFREPVPGLNIQPVIATQTGYLADIDNRRLAKVAKLAGAPASAGAGIDFRLRLGDSVQIGQPLFHIYSDTPGELDYAIEYATANPDILSINENS
jgi:thymidine phosphorylase